MGAQFSASFPAKVAVDLLETIPEGLVVGMVYRASWTASFWDWVNQDLFSEGREVNLGPETFVAGGECLAMPL